MAGVVSTSMAEREQSLAILRSLEQDAVGKGIRTLWVVLEQVHRLQAERRAEMNHGWDVDWMEVMREGDLQVVRFGL